MSDILELILNDDWFTFAVECVAMASACAACLAALVLAVNLAAGSCRCGNWPRAPPDRDRRQPHYQCRGGDVGGPNERPLSVQVPSIVRRACTASAELTSGESLLLHPLEEKPGHRRNYIVITATIISSVE
jgi:hypothetical protein